MSCGKGQGSAEEPAGSGERERARSLLQTYPWEDGHRGLAAQVEGPAILSNQQVQPGGAGFPTCPGRERRGRYLGRGGGWEAAGNTRGQQGAEWWAGLWEGWVRIPVLPQEPTG